MAKTKWQFYQWYPKDFWSDYRLNGISGKSIAILRSLHDLLWMELDKCLPDDQQISKRLRLSTEDWTEARSELIRSGLLLSEQGGLTAIHITEYWDECRRKAAIRAGNVTEINEARKKRKNRSYQAAEHNSAD